MSARGEILDVVAGKILSLAAAHTLRVAIDGDAGAGKTTFAQELALLLTAAGRKTLRASIDSFHRPKAQRYRLGPTSPEGFYFDSHDFDGLKEVLLDPLGPNGSGWYRAGIFDHLTDSPVTVPHQKAETGDVLLFDGIFLHRPELRAYWDFSIFLDVPFSVSIPRGAQRGPGYGSSDPLAESNRRYIEGQKLYLAQCKPQQQATLVIDNTDLARPIIIST